jgi:hypothetical protein
MIKKGAAEVWPLSSSIRRALQLFLDTKRSEQALLKLQELQREDRVQTTCAEGAALIREDRTR